MFSNLNQKKNQSRIFKKERRFNEARKERKNIKNVWNTSCKKKIKMAVERMLHT